MNTTNFSQISVCGLPRSLLAVALMLTAGWAQAVDWSGVPATDVPLFYPGQASWEWVMTEKDHSGAPKFRSGKNCKACHDGEQGDIGNTIVSGEKLVPAPVAGRPGGISLHVQTARDAERLYFRLRWKAGSGAPALDADTAARVTVMIDDGTVKEAARAGCWGSCHDDSIGMASASADGRTTKYLSASRSKLTRQGGGENIKPAADLAALKSSGAFLEYWQAKVNPGQPAKAVSGYILDKRHEATGAAVAADASFEGGEWTVVLSRPLVAAGEGSKSIVAGKTYNIGFAVHDDHADHRHHHVSFEYTLALDGSGSDFVARAK
jgi:cytochrome c-type protein NapC